MVRIVLSLVAWFVAPAGALAALAGALVAPAGALAAVRVLWVSEAPGGGRVEVGSLAGTTLAPWLLAMPQPGSTFLTGLRWREASPEQGRANLSMESQQHLLPWAPRAARLLRFADGETLVFSVEALEVSGGRDSLFAVFLRRTDKPGGPWAPPVRLSSRTGRSVDLGVPRLLRAGKVLLPVVWDEREKTLGLYASMDSGVRWSEVATQSWPELEAPALAEVEAGRLLLVAPRGGELVACESDDGGVTWSAWRGLGIAAAPTGIALAPAGPATLALAWTDPLPDTTQAPPALQALRLSFSTDAGATWKPPTPLVLRPGRLPVTPALLADGERLVAAWAERAPTGSPESSRIVCLGFGRRELQEPAPVASAEARYGIDPAAARASLALLCAHTLGLPEEPRWLFVEGYLMRGLAAAAAVFASYPGETPEWFDTRACGERALAWADSLAARQDKVGYWSIGYGAVFIADIAAALAIFPALESRAGEEQLRRWEAAARRFVTALEEDEMILPSGAFGIGWPGSAIPRVRLRASRVPYLVSTALAGIELHAWLARRSGSAADRERALRALDWTLAQVQKDGGLPRGPGIGDDREGALVTAAYVQEGWMAADLLLGGREVRSRLRAVLPRHVQWLLRQQRPDGSWDSGADGEFARTPACVNFLVWYDRRVESRADVREAIRRAGLRLVDQQQWPATGLFAVGNHHEVLRAHAGRVLAALGREEPVW